MFFRNNSLFIYRTCAVFFILLCIIHGRDAVRFECKTSLSELVRHCDVGTTTQLSRITLLEQDEGSYCVKNRNFFLVLNGTASYIWVLFGCSGVFDVYKQASVTWGPWGSCSVTCGAGTKTRSRSCSTGSDEDCVKLPDWSAVTESCNEGSCKDETRTGPPLCGFSPTGYRVFGGQDAKTCQFPWMAMVHKSDSARRCGGTIVDQTHILTAAHCLSSFDERMLSLTEDQPDTLKVYTGSSYMPLTEEDDPDDIPGLVQHTVTKVDVHEDFNAFNFENDIAVLTLSKPIVYGQCTVPACMIDSSMSVYDTKECVTMGWGRTEDPKDQKGTNKLKWTNVNIVSKERCRYLYDYMFHPKNFCAGGNGHDSCEGDSGSPLLCKGPWNRYYQYGIVSSGYRNNCGYYGGQYINLQNYTEWLSERI